MYCNTPFSKLNTTMNANLTKLDDNMFTLKNLNRFCRSINGKVNVNNNSAYKNEHKNKRFDNSTTKSNPMIIKPITTTKPNDNQNKYYPKQTDSLFWCFYILKNGYSNYEMEINNQYFVVEKTEKFKYITMLRNSKDLLKIHKIKPFTELEDDLANKDKISVKTFCALCILENINVLLVHKRKILETICHDIDKDHPIHIIHQNSQTGNYFIELNVTDDNLNNYRTKYYKMENYDAKLKSVGSYKLEELLDLCKKLDIPNSECENKEKGKKKTKNEIYELLVLRY